MKRERYYTKQFNTEVEFRAYFRNCAKSPKFKNVIGGYRTDIKMWEITVIFH